MTSQEFEIRKDKLRQEAVDKEVQRLRTISKNQSRKITKLRKALYFQAFFFVSLFVVLVIKGMISLTGSTSNEEVSLLNEKLKSINQQQTSLSSTLVLYRDSLKEIIKQNLDSRNEEGYKYRIQIGAFKEINLSDFKTNLVAINQETYDSICQYTLGRFDDYQKAFTFWNNIKRMGFNDSFIIATKNGRRIPIEQLPQDIKKKNEEVATSFEAINTNDAQTSNSTQF